MAADILSNIQKQFRTFSKGQKRIANYILEAYDKAAFMTANRLGKTVGVSESTVVRFAVELGFSGYPSMQKTLQELVRNKLTSVQRIEVANDRIGNHDVISAVLQSDIDTLRQTNEMLDHEQMDASVAALLRARRIYIVGVRSSTAIAVFLDFYFRNMFDNVHLVKSSATSEIFEQMIRISPEDVVVAISLPRYSNRTIRAMQFALDRGATTIAITDKPDAPAGKLADHILIAKSDMVSIVDSLVAPMSVVNALIVAVSRKQEEQVSRTFKDLEELWDEYDVNEWVK